MKHLFQFIREIKTLRTAAARGLSLLLVVALIFSALPPPSFALTEADFEVIWLEEEYERTADFSSEGFAIFQIPVAVEIFTFPDRIFDVWSTW